MLKRGKLKENALKRSVLKEIKTKRAEVLCGARIGEDSSILDIFQGRAKGLVAVTTNPVTIPCKDMGKISIIRALNNLSSNGAEPVGVTISILLPEGIDEKEIKTIMRQAEEVCSKYKVQIIGGHTEVTCAVNFPVVTVTAIGNISEKGYVLSSGIKPGDDIILTKWIGLEGTSVIAKEKEEDLLKRFPGSFVEQAKQFGEFTSIQEEAFAAIDFGVSAMHDLSTGGVFGALWEMAEASKTGLDIDLMAIPIRQETVEICEVYGLNPYELTSAGSLLIASNNGKELVGLLDKADIPAMIIGKATSGNDRILRNDDEIRYLDMPKADEILKIYG